MYRESRKRAGFTLVEVMVVIVVIGILAGLISVAAAAALRRAKIARIKLEIDNIAGAFEQYKSEVGKGEYPPNFTDANAVKLHLRRAFPRIAQTELDSLPSSMNPAEALVFWLGGFSDNPRYPLTGTGGPLNSERANGVIPKPKFDFDRSRLEPATNGLVYYPQNQMEPYVYIDTTRLDSGATNMPTYSSTEGGGSIGYYEPKAPIKIDFEGPQILSASLDDKWGGTNGSKASKMYGESMTGPHADNLASFAPKELSKVE